MADFSNNVGSNIVFNAEVFAGADKISSKKAKYVSSNSSHSNEVETVDLADLDDTDISTYSDSLSITKSQDVDQDTIAASSTYSNSDFNRKSKEVDHDGNADFGAWETQMSDDAKKPVTDYFNEYIDVNNDGKVDQTDFKLISGELYSNSVDNSFLSLHSDLNGDGKVDDTDLTLIQKYINGEDIAQYVDTEYLTFKKSVLDTSNNSGLDVSSALDNRDFAYETDYNKSLDIYFKKNADFNGDGKIDKTDVTALLLSNSLGSAEYDFNSDGKSDENDSDILEKYVNGEDISNLIDKDKILADVYAADAAEYAKQSKALSEYKQKLVAGKDAYDKNGGEEGFKRKYGMTYDQYNQLIKDIDSRINDINYKKKSANAKSMAYKEKSTFNANGELKNYKHDKSAYWQDIDYEDLVKYYNEHGGDISSHPQILKLYEKGEEVDWIAIIEYFQIEKGIMLGAVNGGYRDSYVYYNMMTDEERKEYHNLFKTKGTDAAEKYLIGLRVELVDRMEKYPNTHNGCAFGTQYDHYSMLTAGQKKYFKYLYDTQGKEAAEEYLSSIDAFTAFKRGIDDDSINTSNQKTEKDYTNEYLKKNVDFNNDGKLDKKDYVALKNMYSNYTSDGDFTGDLNGDGIFNEDDLKVFDNYLQTGDISEIIQTYEYFEYKSKAQLDEYTKKRDALEKTADNIRNYYNYDLSDSDRKNLLNEVSQQIAMYNAMIVNQKKTVAQLPYLNLTYSEDYKRYSESYGYHLEKNEQYEKLYNDYKSSPSIFMSHGDVPDDLDWLALIDYFMNVKGEKAEDILPKFPEYERLYRYMTDEQQTMYHYLYKTKGEAAAEEYVNVLEDDITRQQAIDNVKDYIDTLDIKVERDENGNIIRQSLDSSFKNAFGTSMKGLFEGGTEDYTAWTKWGKDGYTMEEYEQMYYLQYLSSNGFLEGVYGSSKKVGKVVNGVVTTTIITAAFPEAWAVAGGLAASAFNTAVSTNAAGANAQHSALVEGYSLETANSYAQSMMQNNIMTSVTSTAIGYGIIPSIQYAQVLKGASSFTQAYNLSLSLANMATGASIAALSAKQQNQLQQVYLNKAEIDADTENQQMLQAFIDSIVMGAVSTGVAKTFTVVRNGVKNYFSTDDWITYLKSSDNPTAEDFVNSYSGKVLTPSGEWVNSKQMTSKEYMNEALRILNAHDYNSLPAVEKNNFNHLFDKMDGDDIVKVLSYLNATENSTVLNELITYSRINTPFMNKLTATLLTPTLDYYEKAANFAGSGAANNYKTYRAHTEAHVQEVAQKALEAVKNLKASLADNPVDGFSQDVSSYEIFVSALWHDVGMGAGDAGVIGYNSGYDADGRIVTSPLVETKNGNVTRSNHSFNSAINVLANYDSIAQLGVDPNTVALLAFAHSKSNSGVRTVNDVGDWSLCIDKINSAIKFHNESHPDNPIVFGNTGGTDFVESLVASGILIDDSTTAMTTNIYKDGELKTVAKHNRYRINQSKLGELATGTYSLRLGDANTNNNNIGTNQAGEKIDMSTLQRKGTTSFDTSHGFKNPSKERNIINELVEAEAAGSTIQIGSDTVELDLYGAGYILGEANVDFSTDVTAKGSFVERFTVSDPSEVPACTVFNIDERLGEVSTASRGGFKTKIEIRLSSKGVSESLKPQIEAYYKAFAESRGIDPANVVWI